MNSSETTGEVVARYAFKRKANITNKGITFKFCIKNMKNILTIKEPTNR